MMDIIKRPVKKDLHIQSESSVVEQNATDEDTPRATSLSTEAPSVGGFNASESLMKDNTSLKKPFGLFVILLAVLVFLAGGAALYFYTEYASLTEDPNAVNQKKIEEVVAKVGKLIDLPTDEVPTLATISDTESLKDQPFFENAEIGDEVLLYSNVSKAYLYRPSKNILVEVASLASDL
jgi:hypothetical protein